MELGGLGLFVMVRVEGGRVCGAGWTGTLCDGEEGGCVELGGLGPFVMVRGREELGGLGRFVMVRGGRREGVWGRVELGH